MCEAWARPLLQLTEPFLLQEVLELAFSILYDPDETLNFIAPNKYEVSSVALPCTAPCQGPCGSSAGGEERAGQERPAP